jgi:hypothetical protein
MLISIGQGFGLNCGFQTVITLPCPAFYVTLALAHSASPAKIDAFDENGNIVAEAEMTAGGGVLETITLTAEKGMIQLVIHAPQNETVLQEICYSCSADGGDEPSSIRVRALMGSTPVDETVLLGSPGQIITAQLAFDTITAVEFSSGRAAVVDICFNLISRGALRGWQMLDDFPYPMCLPVAHSDYPCVSKPSTQPQAEDVAVDRVSYGDPDVWRGASFDDLHKQLEMLVENGPPPIGDPMALRETSVTGVPETPGPEAIPEMPHQRRAVLVGSDG